MVRDLDIHCPKGHCYSNIIFTVSKGQTQEITIKKPCIKESKLKMLKLAKSKALILSCLKFTKPGKTFHIDKKKEYLKIKRDRKNMTLATRDQANTVKAGEKK